MRRHECAASPPHPRRFDNFEPITVARFCAEQRSSKKENAPGPKSATGRNGRVDGLGPLDARSVGQFPGVLQGHTEVAHVDQGATAGADAKMVSLGLGRPPNGLADNLTHGSNLAAVELLEPQYRVGLETFRIVLADMHERHDRFGHALAPLCFRFVDAEVFADVFEGRPKNRELLRTIMSLGKLHRCSPG
jgi:hypothetical protein